MQSSQASVKYPKGWPISAITVPPGSTRAILKHIKPYTNDGGYTGVSKYPTIETYWIGFKFKGTWQEADSHLEQCVTQFTNGNYELATNCIYGESNGFFFDDSGYEYCVGLVLYDYGVYGLDISKVPK
jgi:hypothetical protein